MKTKIYPFAFSFRNLIALILTLLILKVSNAQDVVINSDPVTWGWSDGYPSTTVNGNLTITGSVPDLVELGDNFWQNLSSVTGSLIIDNADNLSSLNGLQHVVSIGGDLIIQNCDNLSSLSGLENVLSIGGSLIVSNNPSICCFTTNAIWSLQSVQNITITGNQNLSQTFGFPNITALNDLTITNNNNLAFFAPFTSLGSAVNITVKDNPNLTAFGLSVLQSANSITIDNNASLPVLNAFASLQSAGVIEIRENHNMTTITSFDNLTSVVNLLIIDNNALNSVSGFDNVQSISYLEINNNDVLAACCFAPHLIAKALAPTAILANAPGCESVAVVNAPPAIPSCAAGQSVNTPFNTCNGEVTIVLPVPIDNCDLVTKHALFTLGDGSISYDGAFLNQATTIQFVGTPGNNTLLFTATDANNQSTTCLMNITVFDNQEPTPPAGFPDKFDVNAGTNCIGTFSLTADGFSENCGIDHYNINISQGGSAIINENVAPGTNRSYDLTGGTYSYQLTAFDVNGLSGTVGVPINVLDITAPAWTETNLVKVVEIECGSMTIAAALAANMPTATDCSSVDVVVDTTIPTTTTCGLQEVRHIIIARDTDFNSSPVYDLTIRTVDNTAPVLAGVPADITIGCNDAIPGFGGITAMDACDGNLTSSITFTEIPGMGSCGNGVIAETFSNTARIIDACGNVAEQEWNVTVVSDFSFSLGADIQVCDGGTNVTLDPGITGETYQWSTGANSQAIAVNQSGTYSLTITSSNGCCFIDEIDVATGDNPDVSAQGGAIDCSSGSIQLTGGSTTSGATFSWSGPASFSSNEQNPAASQAGTYTLLVTSSTGCTAETTVEVTSNTDVPDASAEGGAISCASTTTQLFGTSTTNNVSYEWTGPENFSSIEQNPSVSEIGTYTLKVLADNGCFSTVTAEVTGNTEIPTAELAATTLSCKDTTVSISITSTATILSYAWSGPEDFTSTDATPIVSVTGAYAVIFTAANGCEGTANIDIEEDILAPDLMATGGTLSCTSNFVALSSSSTATNVTYSWTGPDNFTSALQNPEASQPGTYHIMITGENGCAVEDSVMVMADTDLPEVSAVGGAIDCLTEEVLLQGSTTAMNVTTSWSGPNGFASTQLDNLVATPGSYTFTVVAETGCTSFKTVEVIVDNQSPNVSLGEGSVDCNNGSRQFNISTNAGGATYNWVGPDNFTSDELAPSYSMAGLYSVTVTATNNCTSAASIEIANNIGFEVEIMMTGSQAEAIIIGGTGPFTYIWDDAFGESTKNNLVDGEHTLSVIDGLGCVKDFIFTISTSSIFDTEVELSIKLFPNPATDYIRIESTKDQQPKFLEIFNVSGTRMLKQSIKSHATEVNIQNLKTGIYMIRVESEDKVFIKKFMKI